MGNAISSGVIVVASAGNGGVTGLDYPAGCSGTGVIAVGASMENGNLAPYSNGSFGADFLVAAPGDNIISTLPTDTRLGLSSVTGTGPESGTSMAAPHVTALVALLRGVNPGLSLRQIKLLIAQNADKVGGGIYRFNPDDFCPPDARCSWNDGFGYGRINVARTLCAAVNSHPIVQAISPAGGPVSGGTGVTVTGACLSPLSTARVGNAPAVNPKVVSPAQVTLTTPPTDKAGLADIVLMTPSGQSLGGSQSLFAYGPIVTGVSPGGGPVGGGTTVTVTGLGFGDIIGATPSFLFDGVAASNVNCSGTGVCTMGSPGATGAKTADVQVAVGGVLSPKNASDKFRYGPPTIDRILPNAGPDAGGIYVDLYGQNFLQGSGTTILFGTIPSPYTNCLGESWCQAYAPPGTGGVHLRAVVNGAASDPSSDLFSYFPQPTILSLSPNSAPATGGNVLTLLGSHFAIGSTGTKVMFGPNPAASIQCNNSTACLVTTPPGAGAVEVSVEVNGVANARSVGFTYVPILTSVRPNAGPQNGGTSVIVSGTGFSTGNPFLPGPTIAFGNAVVMPSCNVSTCNVISPSGAGTVDVRLTLDGATSPAVVGSRFTYQATKTKGWTHWIPSSVRPSPGSGAYDEARHGLVMLGAGEHGAETWTWSAGTWQMLSPAHSPASAGTGMVYDRARGNIVMFGQIVEVGRRVRVFAGTSLWNGTDWSTPVLAQSPPARVGQAMVYDAARKQVLMFGGCSDFSCNQILNDFWAWDGATWRRLSQATTPSARNGAQMAALSATGDVLLFGGSNAGAVFLNETWLWNGTNWSLQAPAQTPAVRYALAMTSDPVSRGAVLIGGVSTATAADTWLWNGGNWTALTLPVHPNVLPAAFVSDAPTGLDWLVDVGGDVWSWGGRP